MNNKELTDLEICRGIARIKTLGFAVDFDGKFSAHNVDWFPFNPITDNALNLELRDEYELRIIYDKGYVYLYSAKGLLFTSEFTDKSQINLAVCLCILESVK